MIAALVRFSVHRPGLVIGLALAVAGFGVFRLFGAHLDVFPEFSPAQVVIQSEAPGLDAEAVEALVTAPVEAAIAGVAGLESVRSQSIPGLSVVTVTFAEGGDLHRHRQLVAERLAGALPRLPAGIVPGITPLTSSASTLLGVGLTSAERSLFELRALADWTVKPHLLSVPGVADVNVFGGKLRQWQVQLEPLHLARHGVTVQDAAAAARKATALRGLGHIENANQRIVIAAEAQAAGVAELARVPVAERGGQAVLLGDLGRVAEAAAPSISAASIDGREGVFLMVQGQLGANTHAVTLALEQALAELAPLLARESVTLHPGLFRPANFIETAVGNVRSDVLIGAALVVSVLFLFLFNSRTAFISAVAIPLSLLAAILVLEGLEVSLNIMVLGGLAIALGEVVDDAIIDCENIFRRLRENGTLAAPRPPRQVVFDASMEVRSSVVYATFVVALVFVPLLTLPGIAGKLFAPLGLAYIFAILASLVVAVTVTPALSCLLLARGRLSAADPPLIRWIKPRYAALLTRIERRPRQVIAAAVLATAGGLGMLPLFAGEFIPPLKEGHYIIHMAAIPGTSQAESLRIGQRVSAAIRAIPGVQSVAQWVGRAENGADTFGVHYSEFEVEIGPLPGEEQRRILAAMRRVLAGEEGGGGAGGFPGVNFAVNTFLTERIEETVGGYPAAVVINLFGPELDRLDRDALAVARSLSGVKGATGVEVQAPPGQPQLSVRLRYDRLAAEGLAPADVLDVLQAAYAGLPVGQVYREGRTIPVAVTLAEAGRRNIAQVAGLALRSPAGRIVPLSQVADVALAEGRYKILHEGGKRMQTVTCNLAPGEDLRDFVARARARLAEEVSLSPGNYLVVTGAAAAEQAARQDLLAHSLLAGTGVAGLLYLAFGSLRNLALTFVNLPFALIGGVLAVLVTGGWVTLGSLMGFVTLFGITLRNSIMLVSHYQHLVEREGEPWNSATAIRGALERLPSILMTALVAALGLLPLALGSGQPGREIEGPMAAIIVGGLATSTLLNLLVLPTVLLHHGRFRPAGERP